MTVDITYGILNFNPHNHVGAEQVLRDCLESFEANTDKDLTKEVYLIDQASDHNRQQELLTIFANKNHWRMLFLDRNIGISRGINLLAKIARGEKVCLITSDTIFSKGLEIDLLKQLELYPGCWQICPASDNASIPYQKAGYQDKGIFSCIAQELTIQMWPRFVFDKIGYFDERWKACYENLDFVLRMAMAGGFAAISHESFCHHKHEMTKKSGARNETYSGYLHMPNGFDQGILHEMWTAKWPGLDWDLLYRKYAPMDFMILSEKFKHNMYSPYLQNIGY